MLHSVERPAFAHLALRPSTIMLSCWLAAGCWLHRASTARGTVWTILEHQFIRPNFCHFVSAAVA
ncbi:uncharacterized protein BDZ83DRAFT_435728 [Colletotrichum acutatum]|uniref:Uncharacterized protein n=1 Tax=Glomerella acutata TaxID=27357 RepID=A0AAD8XEX0_GLOAC|nr:uncharacterized protein BDZ83DRAFT_435728 [Colletotrichum acutatum]KAK1721462.1 hypothetical protein BDZ83DRAFT_435728 [Colletotrichum acutatum]